VAYQGSGRAVALSQCPAFLRVLLLWMRRSQNSCYEWARDGRREEEEKDEDLTTKRGKREVRKKRGQSCSHLSGACTSQRQAVKQLRDGWA